MAANRCRRIANDTCWFVLGCKLGVAAEDFALEVYGYAPTEGEARELSHLVEPQSPEMIYFVAKGFKSDLDVPLND